MTAAAAAAADDDDDDDDDDAECKQEVCSRVLPMPARNTHHLYPL
jgi:hypothetical protein